MIVKKEAKLKLFYSMLKCNYLFVAPNLSRNVIAFTRDHPLERRPWVFKIPRYKPWSWPEIKFLSNSNQNANAFQPGRQSSRYVGHHRRDQPQQKKIYKAGSGALRSSGVNKLRGKNN